MAEGGDSTRVGGVHIELSVQGADKAREDIAQLSNASKEAAPAAEQLGTATGQAAARIEDEGRAARAASEEIERLGQETKKAEDATSGMSERGLAGMLLRIAALRKALTELSETIDVLRNTSGSDEAVHIFSEQGISGAEKKLREISEWSSKSSTALGNASEALDHIAHLDISGLVQMFTNPGKFTEEQERLATFIARANKEAADKKRRDDEDADEFRRHKEDSAEYNREQEKKEAEEERIRRREEADDFERHKENSAEMERERQREEKVLALADKFNQRINDNFDKLVEKIQSGPFGAGAAGGDMSGVIEVLERIERAVPRGYVAP